MNQETALFPTEAKAHSSFDHIESVIQMHQKEQRMQIRNYLNKALERSTLPQDGLYILQETAIKGEFASLELAGGYYIRSNGKGIVINPGSDFLKIFHAAGLHIKDIDFVIVTESHPQSYRDIKDIYLMNARLNQMSTELKVIHYYLNPIAYEELAPVLKPHFSSERYTVHCLEFFMDSKEVEQIELSHNVYLNYFIADKGQISSNQPRSIGIRLDLVKENKVCKVAYIGKTRWTPFMAHDVEQCDILITAFGSTQEEDFQKIQYKEDALGFYGCLSLVDELKPLALIVTEFDGKDGDVRLEVIKELKKENQAAAICLPGNTGLVVDLEEFTVDCSSTGKKTALDEIRSVKLSGAFKPLSYLSTVAIG